MGMIVCITIITLRHIFVVAVFTVAMHCASDWIICDRFPSGLIPAGTKLTKKKAGRQ
jgi:hypothetical protein